MAGLMLWSGLAASAQEGADNAYSPYSVFGAGDLVAQGTAYNKSMGGVGVATRNRRVISYLNPASITARDTMAFMLDFGVTSDNRIFRQGGLKSADNTFNISNLAFTVPIYRKSAFLLGVAPYSSVAYGFSSNLTDPAIIGHTGKIHSSAVGDGGLYMLFGGPAVTLFQRLSVGVQAVYYFGNIDKNSAMTFLRSGYKNFSSGYKLELNAFTGKFGLQYEQPLPDGMSLVAGAVYTPKTKLKGYVTDFKYTSLGSKVDTIRYRVDTLSRTVASPSLAGEIGVGLSFRKGEKWSVELNYLRSDWTGSAFGSTPGFANRSRPEFVPAVAQSLRAGFEIVPNRNDIRYYLKRCAYRGGLYYNEDYYRLAGHAVRSYGLTLGVTFPVFQFHNGISLGVDVGQRGGTADRMTRETYAKFVIGFNISDIWFKKLEYD